MKTQSCAMALSLLVVATVSARGQTVLYVDDDAAPGGNGATWASAFRYLQDALTAMRAPGSTVTEIRIAQGLYQPDRGINHVLSNPLEVFNIDMPVSVSGGYRGGSDPVSAGDYNPELFVTVLSGDLNGDDMPAFTNRLDNSRIVMTAGAGSTIRGATIRGAHHLVNMWIPDSWHTGGGIVVSPIGSVEIDNCVFIDNQSGDGAGCHWESNDQPQNRLVVRNCKFIGNWSYYDAAGLDTQNAGTLVVTNCLFLGNTSQRDGGAMVLDASFGNCVRTVVNCAFIGNRTIWPTHGDSERGGGALLFSSPNTSVDHCLFASNSCGANGGALHVHLKGFGQVISNCILVSNAAQLEGNNVFLRRAYAGHGVPSVSISYSLIDGGVSSFIAPGGGINVGMGILDVPPLFVDPLGADSVPGSGDEDFHLQSSSPGIDAGSNDLIPADSCDLDDDGNALEPVPFDLDRNERRADVAGVSDSGDPGTVGAPVTDIGPYEYITPPTCPGDADGDGMVGLGDIATIIIYWASNVPPAPTSADLDGSRDIGLGDIAAVIVYWGNSCS